MKTHDLKVWTEFFDDIASGRKPFELRRDDRPFAVGDQLHLQEYRQAIGEYTGRSVHVEVTYLLRNTKSTKKIGLPDGFCIMGIKLIEAAVAA